MAAIQLHRTKMCDSFSRTSSLLTLTMFLTVSFLCAATVRGSTHEGPEHVPTLKEIYGGIPKNSFPVVRREARMLQFSSESGSKSTQLFPGSFRRGLRSKPNPLTVQVSDVGFNYDTAGLSEYYAQIQIGTPPQDQLLVIDTGSPYVWTQSKQCTECYPQLLPRYDPTISSTFEPVNGTLVYNWGIVYGDGGENRGYLAKETLTFDSGNGNRIVITEFEFAVATNNTGSNYDYSGILGLGPAFPGGGLSPLLTQLETISDGAYSKFSKKFRYCFPDRVKQANTTSFLSFGEVDESAKHKSRTLWTPLVPTNTSLSPYYALNLTAITVDGMRISIDPKELTLESVQVNQTMTIIDTGTSVNSFREPYLSQFVEAYYNATIPLGPQILLDNGTFQLLYYNISKDVFDGSLFPSVSFIFQKWRQDGEDEHDKEIEVFLSKDNLLIPRVDASDVIYELNMIPGSGSESTIGNYAQENFLIEFDLEKSRVGFLHASCTFDY